MEEKRMNKNTLFRFIMGIVVVIMMTFSLIVIPASASTQSYTSGPEVHAAYYSAYGPSLYYGVTVEVEYTSIKHWTIKINNGDLVQHLQQHGKAEIYSYYTGELLDTRAFVFHEKIVDDGMDAGYWDGNLYKIRSSDFSKLEVMEHKRLIPGVWHFKCYAENGVYLQKESTVPGIH